MSTTIELVTVDVQTLARVMDESVAVGADWATADADTVREFDAWEAEYRVSRERFDGAVEGEGYDDWRDLPDVRMERGLLGPSRVVVGTTSECGGGGEAIHWWELSGGSILGYSTTQVYWHIPAGTPMPLITDFAYVEDENDDEEAE